MFFNKMVEKHSFPTGRPAMFFILTILGSHYDYLTKNGSVFSFHMLPFGLLSGNRTLKCEDFPFAILSWFWVIFKRAHMESTIVLLRIENFKHGVDHPLCYFGKTEQEHVPSGNPTSPLNTFHFKMISQLSFQLLGVRFFLQVVSSRFLWKWATPTGPSIPLSQDNRKSWSLFAPFIACQDIRWFTKSKDPNCCRF